MTVLVQEVQKAGGAATAAVFDWDSAIGTPAFGEAADLSHGWILGADLVYSHQQVGLALYLESMVHSPACTFTWLACSGRVPVHL